MQDLDHLGLEGCWVRDLQDQPSRGTRGIENPMAGKGDSNEGHRQDLGSHSNFHSAILISMEIKQIKAYNTAESLLYLLLWYCQYSTNKYIN